MVFYPRRAAVLVVLVLVPVVDAIELLFHQSNSGCELFRMGTGMSTGDSKWR